jgi:radical SAM superfamily enzyme YgiQ (UPF0313 family)
MADALVLCGYSKIRFGTKPAGALVVANVIRSLGLTAAVIDHSLAMPRESLYRLIDKFVDANTKFICVSTTLLGPPGSNINAMKSCDRLLAPILDYIRTISPDAKFIVGGSKMTAAEPTELPVDYVVRGQAEVALKAIILHEIRGDPLHTLSPGIVTDKIYGFNDFNTNIDLRPTCVDGVLDNETLPFEFGRGCVFQCAFCNYDMIGKKFGDYNKTEETILSVLLSNYEKFGTTRYQLADDTLNDSDEKIDRIYRISQKLPFQLEFGAYIRVELLEKLAGSASKLLDSGLRGANLGLETLNKTAGATVGKGYGMKAIQTLINARKIWKNSVAVNANFIIGLPHDSLRDLEEQHKIIVEADWIDHAFYTPLGIPHKGDSLFSQGLYKKYYTEALTLHPYFKEAIKQHEETESYFAENLNWQSEEMNSGDAILLARKFMTDFMSKRPYIVNNVTSFCVMSLLENLTMHELRTLRYDESDKLLTGFARNKVQKYIQKMLSSEINIPTTSPVSLFKIDEIIPTKGFKGKRVLPIEFRSRSEIP